MVTKINQIETFRPSKENRRRIPELMRRLGLNKKSKVINKAVEELYLRLENGT